MRHHGHWSTEWHCLDEVLMSKPTIAGAMYERR